MRNWEKEGHLAIKQCLKKKNHVKFSLSVKESAKSTPALARNMDLKHFFVFFSYSFWYSLSKSSSFTSRTVLIKQKFDQKYSYQDCACTFFFLFFFSGILWQNKIIKCIPPPFKTIGCDLRVFSCYF